MLAVAGVAEGGESGLCFAVLGPLQVTRSGQRLALGGRQQRAVLALLLAEGGAVVSVGRLADALWGEETPNGFVSTVQTYVFHLREVLEPGRGHGAPWRVLVTEPGSGYRLDTRGCSVDSADFEGSLGAGREAIDRRADEAASAELARGLGLWRGEVLADLADFGFVGPIAARLQEMRLVAQGLRIEAELALGRHDAALPEIDRLVADHPLREQFHAQRITALYRGGRQSDALAAYRELRARLHEELGIEPSPPLQVLHRGVLAQDPALAWDPPPSAPATTAGNGRGVEGAPAVAPPPARPAPAQQNGPPRRRFGSKAVAAWAVAALLATGGLTTAIVTLSSSSGQATLAANSVGAVEADGSITAAVRVGTNPTGLAYGGGALWVANRSDGSVSRIDPQTQAVTQIIDVGAAPESLTVTADDVWVANFADDTVTRINISAARVVDTIAVGTGPTAIASGPSGVWVANGGDNTIQQINPVTSQIGKPVEVGDGPDGIAVDADSVWVANARDGTVSRIDPKTGLDMSGPIRVGSGPKGIAVSGDDVWVANQLSGSVSRISRSIGPADSIGVGDGPSSVAIAQGSVWVSEQFDGTLTRIDPVTEAVHRFPIGSSARGLAEAGGRVWVASSAFTDPTHRGGTLTVASDHVPGFVTGIDPAQAYFSLIVRPERLVYDGLVTSRLAGGADSQVLVPDLAVEIPQPSDGGKTYTFTLRAGIRYSTGREVHASDFVLAVHKALTLKQGRPDFFFGIVGGQHCAEHQDACDLSAGVLTDNATRRVTFHLTAADPEFLYKLTFFVYPAPPGTSPEEVTTPLPGTGPYMITDYMKAKKFALERNPYFKQWSFAAQPDGYPDAIRWLNVLDDRAAAQAVLSGRADVAQVGARALLNQLKVRYPDRVHSELLASTDFEVLNTSVPPFNNLKARQAVSYAVDRSRLVELHGGPSVAVETCQMLPPKFPSYTWDCPYTAGPADGRYHGPDLKKAQDLVRASGTGGMPVTVHGIVGGVQNGVQHSVNSYFTRLLGRLGYKVRLHEMPFADPSFNFLFNRGNHLQAQEFGWTADFPLASNFYNALLACDAGSNYGEYCNRQLDQLAAEATALEATDPGAALRGWTQIDRTITKQAPIVPTVNQIETTFVSARVGNYQSNQTVGPLLNQLWVK